MNFGKIYIRYKEDLPESEIMFSALEGFCSIGTEVKPFYGFGDICDIEDLGPDVGLFGYIGDVWRALRKLGIKKPEPLDYPDELKKYLGRKIKTSTIGYIRNNTPNGIFVKPYSHKIFTGFVMTGSFSDQMKFASCPNDEKIWISDVVDFESEWRCFVLDGNILDVRPYKGNWYRYPDLDVETIENAVDEYKSKPVACTLDFGTTKTGETVLIEVNDGYSFGNYGLPCEKYAKMIQARWRELLKGEKLR